MTTSATATAARTILALVLFAELMAALRLESSPGIRPGWSPEGVA
jgi:hypothetical protein